MDAESLRRNDYTLSETTTVEIVVWRLPRRLSGSAHEFKYRMALISNRVCVLRFDNEDGKGDHKHIGDQEYPYDFIDLTTLDRDFWKEVEAWLAKRSGR
jgi:hypothetical protein